MTTDTLTPPRVATGGAGSWLGYLPLVVGVGALAVPTVVRLGQQTWATEAGAHGPIVIATGLWLLHHNGLRLADSGRAKTSGLLLGIALGLSLAVYVFGRAYDFISLEAAGLYAVLVALLYGLFGLDTLRRQAFPLFYLAFTIPPPGWLIDRVTAPLQELVSWAAGGFAELLGYPIARQGVALVVAQYQLLVEDACAGMNSLIGLIAIGLFYIYLLHRASWRYGLLLFACIVPVAIAINIVRVIVLILITYHWGDEAAQGYLHSTTGVVLFGAAVLTIFALDKAFRAIGTRAGMMS